MLRALVARLATTLATLLAVVTGAFFMMRAAPGGPFDLERPLDPAVLENVRKIYRLDEPLWRQYLDYLSSLLHGDFGPSYFWRDISVGELFAKAMPVSARLALVAIVAAALVGVGAGAFAATRARTRADFVVTSAASIGVTLPNFVVAPLLQLVFGLWLRALPIGGWGDGAVRNLVLPAATLALPQIAVVARLTRAAMVEAFDSPATRTAHAYGLPQRVVVGRAFRSALLPLVTYLGPASAALLTGSVVVETIFGLPGMGRYFVEAALNRDYTLAMGTVVIVAAHILVDPRIRHG
jgi:oligopeptide transport system permease protein